MNATERQSYRGSEAAIPWRAEVADANGEPRAAGLDAARPGIAEWIRREAAIAWAACGAFEWVALGYLGVTSVLIVMFAENLLHPLRLVAVQAIVAAMILILCWVEARTTERAFRNSEMESRTDRNVCPAAAQTFWHFWRHWYPHLFFLFCFEELGEFMHLVVPRWQDAKLIAADYWPPGAAANSSRFPSSACTWFGSGSGFHSNGGPAFPNP